jgi:hypothetical protein
MPDVTTRTRVNIYIDREIETSKKEAMKADASAAMEVCFPNKPICFHL